MESLLHSGLGIQFVLSMVYWLSVIQISHPAGFVYFVDTFECDTAKFEPKVISQTTLYGSHQIDATSLQWIRVQSLMVKLPKSSPHHLRMDVWLLLRQVVRHFYTLDCLCLKISVLDV